MEDKPKADLLLVGMILTFLLLTLLAFLLNEGKKYCVIPLKKRFFPKEEDDDITSDDESNQRIAGVYNRRSTYANAKNEAGFSQSREMNTIAEGFSSSEDYKNQVRNVDDTKM